MSSKDVVVAAGSGDPMQGGQGEAELSPKRSDGGRARPRHLERGWVRHRLIRDLALGDRTQGQLAEVYGCSRSAISQFGQRYRMEIDEVRNNLADEYAGLWVAQKMARIAEYQDAAEKMAKNETPRNAEVLVTILKAVAEELGQLPARTQVNVQNNQVEYQIVGINPDDI